MKKYYKAILLLFCVPIVLGVGGCPDSELLVDTVTPYNTFHHHQAYYPTGDKYTPPWATERAPVSFLVPNNPSGKVQLRYYFDGWAARPIGCIDPGRYQHGYLTAKVCPDAYPDSAVNDDESGQRRWTYYGPLGGENYVVKRVAGAMHYAWEHWRELVDWNKGIMLEGSSYGGHGSIMLAMNMEDSKTRDAISVVRAITAHSNVSAPGRFYDTDFALSNSWREVGRDVGDFEASIARGDFNHIYFRAIFSPADTTVQSKLEVVDWCEQYRIPCFLTYHNGGHWVREDGFNITEQTFTDPNQTPSIIKPVTAFNHSTANSDGPLRGHYNLGLSWHTADIISTRELVSIPYRYKRHTGFGKGVPDQPEQVTFSPTIRPSKMAVLYDFGQEHAQHYQVGQRYDWVFGDRSGTVEVIVGGEITIHGLTLDSSDDYTRLELRPVTEPIEPPPVEPPTKPDWQMVYTVQKHYTHAVEGTPIEQASNWTHTTGVARINVTLARASVVIDDLQGNKKILHNCMAPDAKCVAQEGRVSPDGKRIAYSVGYSDTLVEARTRAGAIPVGIMELPYLTHAEIFIYNLETGETQKVPLPRAIHRQPDWVNDGRLVISSNMGDTWPFKNQLPFHADPARKIWPVADASQNYGYGDWGKSMQIWSVNIDGTNATNYTPHAQMAISPAVMSNSDILYSCWNAHGNKSHDGFKSVGPSTSQNKWWLCRMDKYGRDNTVVLNGHKTDLLETRDLLDPALITGGEGKSQLRAIRSVAEIFTGKLAISNYYRANHVGSMGIIFGMDYLPDGVEGCITYNCSGERPGIGRYRPSSLQALTPFGTDQDRYDNRRMFDNRIVGKAGYPAPLPNTETEYLITLMRGLGFDPALPEHATMAYTGGEPVAHKAIYKVKVPVVTNPFDRNQLEFVAGAPEWQVFDARAIAPKTAFYGPTDDDQVPPPDDPDSGCYLQVVDGRAAEMAPQKPYDWVTNLYSQCSQQGCFVNSENTEWFKANMAALTVYLPEMWDKTYRGNDRQSFASNANNMGHKSIALYGSQPLHSDGSARMRVPCETPIMIVGTNKDGMKLAHDEMLHSLRAGESRTCHGCHDGHSEERAAELGKTAVQRFAGTLAYSDDPMPLMSPMPVVSCAADVKPILERRCAGCHANVTGQYACSELAWDYKQQSGLFDHAQPVPIHPAQHGGQFSRPYTSKWVAKFALDSLVYWKCTGARQDGRTDDSYTNDLDYGAPHNSGATENECAIIGRWIDEGAQR